MTVEWVESSIFLATKKFLRALSKVKYMMIFSYDHQGIIITDRSSVWAKCQRTIAWCFSFKHWTGKCTKADLSCSRLGSSFSITIHVHTLPMSAMEQLILYGWEVIPHLPYSPDISPPWHIKNSWKNLCEDVIVISDRPFCRRYPRFTVDEKRWCIRWNWKAAVLLGLCHCDEGRLRWSLKKRYWQSNKYVSKKVCALILKQPWHHVSECNMRFFFHN